MKLLDHISKVSFIIWYCLESCFDKKNRFATNMNVSTNNNYYYWRIRTSGCGHKCRYRLIVRVTNYFFTKTYKNAVIRAKNPKLNRILQILLIRRLNCILFLKMFNVRWKIILPCYIYLNITRVSRIQIELPYFLFNCIKSIHKVVMMSGQVHTFRQNTTLSLIFILTTY